MRLKAYSMPWTTHTTNIIQHWHFAGRASNHLRFDGCSLGINSVTVLSVLSINGDLMMLSFCFTKVALTMKGQNIGSLTKKITNKYLIPTFWIVANKNICL